MRERMISVEYLETVLAKKFRTKSIQYDDLLAAIANMPTMEIFTEWIPVSDCLPETSQRVIVCRKNGIVEQGVFLGVNGWWKIYGTNTKSVTHWMPLPQPPKGE